MGLAISDDHKALADVVRGFAESTGLRAQTRSALEAAADPRPAWKQIAELGWLGLHLPEELGGSGFGLSELAIVAEGLGAGPAPGPFLPPVTAAAVIEAVGSPEQRAALLPSLADGSVSASLAPAPVGDGVRLDSSDRLTGSLDAGAGRGGGGVRLGSSPRLTGSLTAVLGAAWAGLHLVPVGPDLAVVAADAPGLKAVEVKALDPSLGLARLEFENVPVQGLLRDGVAAAKRVLRVLAAAEAAGGVRACLDMALAYAKVRQQFGRPIGGFQAVKHHLANMLIASELATAAAWDAARLSAGPEADLAAGSAA